MKPRKRPPLSFRDVGLLLGIGLTGALIVGALIWADISVCRSVGGGGGFFAPWSAARSFLWGTAGPYSAGAAGVAQQLAYGREALPGENPYRLTLPFFLEPIYFPLALIPADTTARAVWMFLAQAAIVATVFMSMAIVDWHPRPLIVIASGLFAVFSYYPTVALVEGTPVVMLGFLYAATLWTYQNGSDELCGTLLALSLCAWEVGAIFLVLMAWRVFHEQRWRVLGGFGMSLIVLLIISFLIYPGWYLAFLTSTLGMLRSAYAVSTASTLLRLFPAYGGRMAQALTVLVLGLLLLEWATGRESDFRRFAWICCLGLVAAPLIGTRTEMVNLAALLPSLVLVCAGSAERGRVGAVFAAFFFIALFAVPWFLVARGFSPQETRTYGFLFLFFPLVALIGLYWTRWWFLRPRQTWLDRVRTARD